MATCVRKLRMNDFLSKEVIENDTPDEALSQPLDPTVEIQSIAEAISGATILSLENHSVLPSSTRPRTN